MAVGGWNSMVMGRATGLHEPMIMSNGMAAASPATSWGRTEWWANLVVGTGPTSGTRRSSSSARAVARSAASASTSVGAVAVTVSAISRRTAAASSSRPPPLQGRARGGPASAGSATATAEALDHGRESVEHREHLCGSARRHPQYHLPDAQLLVVRKLLVGRHRPERDDHDCLGISAPDLDGSTELGKGRGQTRPADGHPAVRILGDGGEHGRVGTTPDQRGHPRLLDRLGPAPTGVERDMGTVELGLLLGPQCLHAEHVLTCDLATDPEFDPVVFRLRPVPPEADAEDHPPTTEVIECGDLLGQHDRVV